MKIEFRSALFAGQGGEHYRELWPAPVKQLCKNDTELGAPWHAAWSGEKWVPSKGEFWFDRTGAFIPKRPVQQREESAIINPLFKCAVDFSMNQPVSCLPGLCSVELGRNAYETFLPEQMSTQLMQALLVPELELADLQAISDLPNIPNFAAAVLRPRAGITLYVTGLNDQPIQLDSGVIAAVGRAFAFGMHEHLAQWNADIAFKEALQSNASIMPAIKSALLETGSMQYVYDPSSLPTSMDEALSLTELQADVLRQGLNVIMLALRRSGVINELVLAADSGSTLQQEWFSAQGISVITEGSLPQVFIAGKQGLRSLENRLDKDPDSLKELRVLVEWEHGISAALEAKLFAVKPELLILPLPLIRLPLLFLQSMSIFSQQMREKERQASAQLGGKKRQMITPELSAMLAKIKNWQSLLVKLMQAKHELFWTAHQREGLPYHHIVYRTALAGMHHLL